MSDLPAGPVVVNVVKLPKVMMSAAPTPYRRENGGGYRL